MGKLEEQDHIWRISREFGYLFQAQGIPNRQRFKFVFLWTPCQADPACPTRSRAVYPKIHP